MTQKLPAAPLVDDARVDLGEADAIESATEHRARQSLQSVISLEVGDYIIHSDKGLGRFEGVVTLESDGRRDLFEITYRDAKLLVPVEEAALLSRYGGADAHMALDRLRGTAWAKRKARAARVIAKIARRLVGMAAQRALATAPVLSPDEDAYARFSARFPFTPTVDQESAFADVRRDLASGRPMERLVCGDVGCGKTEVAMRAAFIAAQQGFQVAIVAPTTILARQHTEDFSRRFEGLGFTLGHASRLTGAAESKKLRAQLVDGTIDIVIGTHALLARDIAFGRLGLLIVDEEQRFGVQHKERLKQLREGVHVLTLTATPIPRTMQLALSPIRELSLIMTPPSGRKPIVTKIVPDAPDQIAEALRAEHARGGQSFYVCPRIADLEAAAKSIARHAPELRVAIGHGQMPGAELDDIMQAFNDRRFDVLLSTTIVESGLDVPSANTLVVRDAHKLGLAQLYQLRGRVGRADIEAHALLTIPRKGEIGATARRRLEILAELQAVGAGFTLASHDMDIRGAGNILNDEQSGHVRDIGFELFQTLLARAVESLQRGDGRDIGDLWSPHLALGIAARVPARWVPDRDERIGLYWQLARADDGRHAREIADQAAALHGSPPDEVEHLITLVDLRQRCTSAGIAEVIAGPKGGVLRARAGTAFHPTLATALAADVGTARIKRDLRLAVVADWRNPDRRLAGVVQLIEALTLGGGLTADTPSAKKPRASSGSGGRRSVAPPEPVVL